MYLLKIINSWFYTHVLWKTTLLSILLLKPSFCRVTKCPPRVFSDPEPMDKAFLAAMTKGAHISPRPSTWRWTEICFLGVCKHEALELYTLCFRAGWFRRDLWLRRCLGGYLHSERKSTQLYHRHGGISCVVRLAEIAPLFSQMSPALRKQRRLWCPSNSGKWWVLLHIIKRNKFPGGQWNLLKNVAPKVAPPMLALLIF